MLTRFWSLISGDPWCLHTYMVIKKVSKNILTSVPKIQLCFYFTFIFIWLLWFLFWIESDWPVTFRSRTFQGTCFDNGKGAGRFLESFKYLRALLVINGKNNFLSQSDSTLTEKVFIFKLIGKECFVLCIIFSILWLCLIL